MVKLYDLTSLCSEGLMENGQNPFTVPVAMLLYRVARSMKHSSESPKPGTIRALLKNCLYLLSREKYPQVGISLRSSSFDSYSVCETRASCACLSCNQGTFRKTEGFESGTTGYGGTLLSDQKKNGKTFIKN